MIFSEESCIKWYVKSIFDHEHVVSTGIAYVTDVKKGNCTAVPIEHSTFDVRTVDPAHVRMRTAKEFFYFDKANYTYEGVVSFNVGSKKILLAFSIPLGLHSRSLPIFHIVLLPNAYSVPCLTICLDFPGDTLTLMEPLDNNEFIVNQ